MTLEQGILNKKYKVLKLNGEGALRRRLMDMGITKDVVIEIIKFAPMKDPMEIELRGYKLSLRKQEAMMIEVEAYEI